MYASSKTSSRNISDDLGPVSRLEVLTGPTGRRRWPAHVKARLVAESFTTDLAISELARRNGVAPSQLFAWRRLAQDGKLVLPVDEDAIFTPLLVEDKPHPPSPRGTDDTITIDRDMPKSW